MTGIPDAAVEAGVKAALAAFHAAPNTPPPTGDQIWAAMVRAALAAALPLLNDAARAEVEDALDEANEEITRLRTYEETADKLLDENTALRGQVASVLAKADEWLSDQTGPTRSTLGGAARNIRAAVSPDGVAAFKAEVWNEGYAAAYSMARSYGHTDHWEDEPPNPYSTEEESQ